MVDVRPFRALRPDNALASDVIAPPYDVLSEDEARAIAQNRKSFVRVTRSEVDLPAGADSHSDEAYQKAKENLDAFVADGTLKLDDEAHYYFYGQQMGAHRQTGILAAASAPEYDQGLIKKHEYTRPDKEDDRTHHMDVLDAQVGLVFLTYRASTALQALTDEVTKGEPDWRVTTDDDVEHALWAAPASMNDKIKAAFDAVDALYVADGHHRSAAASRIHQKRKSTQSEHFLAGLFPDDALMVLAYNRVVDDLNGHSAVDFRNKVAEKFDITGGKEKPERAGQISMFFEGAWHYLTPKAGVVDESDPVARLDVAVLQDHLLGPVLGIEDPRRSTRIKFVGGIRGPEALVSAVEKGAAVAFHMWPTPLDQLFAVADAGQVMPPKSTWFEPKLREGVCVRLLKDA